MKEQVLAYRLRVPGYELTVEPFEDEWKGCVRIGSQRILARITRQATLADAKKEIYRQAELEARLQGSVFNPSAEQDWQAVTER